MSPIRRAATLHDVRAVADRSLGKEVADDRHG
jgi:hypothetical protein